MDYGVGVSNRYAFLEQDVEDDPIIETVKKVDNLKIADPKGPGKKADKSAATAKGKQPPAGAPKKGPAGTDAHKGKDQPPATAVSEGRGGRGGRGAPAQTGRGRGRGGGSYGEGRSESTDYDSRDKENEYGSGGYGYGGGSTRGRGGGRGRGGYEGSRGGGGYESSRGRGGRMKDSNDGYDEQYEDARGGYDRDFDRQERSESYGYSRGRGGRGTAGGRGGFTRKREFDRQSGSDKSGMKPVDKREGGGAHNWGSYKDEIEDGTNNQNEVEETPEAGRTDEGGQGDGPEGESDVALIVSDEIGQGMETSVEPEPKLMTLEEWKALQQPRTAPEFNIRKPNEGSDNVQWKNLVLKKKEKLEDEEDEYEEDILGLFPQRAGRQKRITDIGFHFGETRGEAERGFRGRGGFRGGRGGATRGGGAGVFSCTDIRLLEKEQRRGYKQYKPAPRVDDVNDFPTLGGNSMIC